MNANLPVRTEMLLSCPLCGSPRPTYWNKGKDRLYRVNEQEFVYSRCAHCALVFASERPERSEMHKFYGQDYRPHAAVGEGDSPPRRSRRPGGAKRWLAKIARAINKPVRRHFPSAFARRVEAHYALPAEGATLLDFGCGSDKFLNHARLLGWTTIGMDFAEASVAAARKSGHTAILCDGDAAWDQIADGSLDFVRMNHVLEHLYEPRQTLARLKSKMRPDATIHIAVPNPSGWSAKLFGHQWHGFDVPRHLMHYGPECLRGVLDGLGFSRIEILHEPLTKDMARSLALRRFDRGRIAHADVDGYADDAKFAEILYLPSRLACALRGADRIHAFAVNR